MTYNWHIIIVAFMPKISVCNDDSMLDYMYKIKTL